MAIFDQTLLTFWVFISSLVKSSILTEKYEENVKKCRNAVSTLQAIKRQRGGNDIFKTEKKNHEEQDSKQ